jgi:hypothetical protein
LCGERLSICAPGSADRCGLYRTGPQRTCKAHCLRAGAKNAAGKSTDLGNLCAKCAKGGFGMKKNTIYALPEPCRGCTRVKNPAVCENKECSLWRQWFIKRWDRVHIYPRQKMEQTVPVGISIGGRRYLHPDHMREYIRNDPCKDCTCTKALCKTPCRTKLTWMNATKEANYELEK